MSLFKLLLNSKYSNANTIRTTTKNLNTQEFLYLVGEIQYILEKRKISKGDIVPLFMSPSIETVATIMALGFIGAAFVPIDISSPRNKIEFILKDTDAKTIITNQKYLILPRRPHTTKIFFENIIYSSGRLPIFRNRCEESTSYIIYTSGSTGNPKGVEISFSNLDFFISAFNKKFPSNEKSVFLLNTALQFDVSISELYGWITNNSSLFILEERELDNIKSLPDVIKDNNITHLSIAPSILNTLGESNLRNLEESDLLYILIAGEEFPVSLAKKLHNLIIDERVYNCYGPTEATVYATYHKLSITDLGKKDIPIGKPFDNIETLLVPDQYSKYYELYLSGKGIAKGYVNLPHKTEEAFPTINGKKYYRTGDLVLLNEDTKDLRFVGRKDFQMKLNSIRVEPGEIEKPICSIGKIEQCVVCKIEKKVTCFYLEGDNDIDIDKMKSELLKTIPSYMIPTIWKSIKTFPLNINGKIDRKHLIENYHNKNIITPIATNKLLSNIRKITGFSNLEMSDNIFELGVDSLSVVEIEMYLETEFFKAIPSGYLYMYPSVYDIEKNLVESKTLKIDTQKNMGNLLHKNAIDYKLINNKDDSLTIEIDKTNYKKLNNIDTKVQAFSSLKNAILKDSMISVFDKEKKALTLVKLVDKNKFNSYESSIFQKVYSYIKLNSFTEAEFDYPDNLVGEVTESLIKYLIQNIEAFRTKISKGDNEKLISNVYNYSEIEVRIKDITTLSSIKQKNTIEKDKESSKKNIIDNLYECPLYNILAYRISFNRIKLVFVLHHGISDGASASILSKYVSSYFQKIPKTSLGMRFYLEQLSKNSSALILLSDKHIKKLESIKNKKYINTPVWENGFKIIHNVDRLDKYKKLLLVADEVTKDFIKIQKENEITFQMLFDFRIIRDYKFDYLLNDCHETVTFYRNKEIESLEFINELYYHIDNFHYKKGISLGLAIYSNFPEFNEEQKKLQEIVETSPINIDYIGEVSKKDLDRKIKEIEMLTHQLKDLKKQTRFTAFSCAEDMYIFQVNNL